MNVKVPVNVDLNDGSTPSETKALNFDQRDSTFVLHNIPDGCIPSVLRDFSAPVKLVREDDVTTEELAFSMANNCLLYTSPSPRDA